MLQNDYYYLDSRGNTGLGIFCGYLLWVGMIFASPAGCPEGLAMKNGAIIYLIFGLITLAAKTVSAINTGETTLWQEIAFGFKNGEAFTELLLWPVIALLLVFRDPFQNSFKCQYHNNYWQELMSERPGIHVETVNEWTDARVANISQRADEQGEMVTETVKPVASVAAAGTLAVSMIAATPVYPQTTNVKAKIFADIRGDRQSSFTASRGQFVLLEQNRVSADRKSNTSLLGIGLKLPIFRGLNTTLMAGPQSDWTKEENRTVVKGIFNFSYKWRGLSLFFANWAAYSPKKHKIVSSRHIQTIGIPGLPKWLRWNSEQLHVKNGIGFKEFYTGLRIDLGQWLKKNSFFHGASLTPYYNWTNKKHWDARLTLAF